MLAHYLFTTALCASTFALPREPHSLYTASDLDALSERDTGCQHEYDGTAELGLLDTPTLPEWLQDKDTPMPHGRPWGSRSAENTVSCLPPFNTRSNPAISSNNRLECIPGSASHWSNPLLRLLHHEEGHLTGRRKHISSRHQQRMAEPYHRRKLGRLDRGYSA